MTTERPAFFEGQILAAADLTSAVGYGRGQVARHERYLHSWGIADGLRLTTSPPKTDAKTGKNYVEVTLAKGVAIDGTGREIVVPEPFTLSSTEFSIANPSAAGKTDYPILLHGLDSNPPAAQLTVGACGAASQPTRTQETFGLTYAGPDGDIGLDEQKVPDESAGPSPDAAQHWEILVGHVQWDPSIPQFISADNNGRRYAGVMADAVAARDGTLTLQTQPTAIPGQPVLRVGGNPPMLTFGLYQGGTAIAPRLTVNADGDVVATGVIKSALTQGEIRVQSGTATDGVRIQLPPGITEDQVASGAVTLHLQLTPHTPQSTTQGSWYIPVECDVDSNRQLTCQVLVGSGVLFANAVLRPGAADYLIVATVESANGATP
jgi:hypothetical protein